jgi:hypothetical protein
MKMKIQKQIFYFVLISFSILLANYIWPLIKLSNNNEIAGANLQNDYHSFSDAIRYISYILIPVTSHILFKVYYEKNSLISLFSNLKILDEKNKYDNRINYFFLLTFVFLILEFLSLPLTTYELDIFHAGQRLSSAFKSSIDGSLWSGSYVAVGIIYETLGTKFIWELFNKQTIGSMIILDLIYYFITKLLIIYLVLLVVNNLNFNLNYKIIFFLISSLILLSANDYNPGSGDIISFREIPIILCLIFFLKSVFTGKNIYYFLIGFLTLFVFFWSIDRGIVLISFIIFILFILIISNKYKQIVILFSSIIFFWFLFFIFLNQEFYFFLENSYSIIKDASNFGGIIHPTPFTDEKNSTRATKNLLSIIFTLIISLSLFFKNEEKYSYQFKITLLSISILSFLSYAYALTRSDGPHLKQAFGFPAIFFNFYIMFNLIYYLSKLKIKLLKSYIAIIFILPIFITYFFLVNVDIRNIFNFKSRFINYISLNDEKFLSKEDVTFVNLTSDLIKDEKCIQLFTNDAALLFLLKKPNCSRYYFVYSIGSIKNQKKMINEMESANIIILNGRTDHWSNEPLETMYPLVYDYINKNYRNYKKISGRLLKIRRN